jgi:hypothetical protein
VWLRLGYFQDEPNERIRFFEAARFEAALWFVRLVLFYENGQPSALVPFPGTSVDEVCWRLLIDWWDRAGQLPWFDQLCLQQRILSVSSSN